MADASGDRSARPRRVLPGGVPGRGASPDPLRRKGEADAWNAFSHLLAGMLLWGGLGWLGSRLLDAPYLVGIGLVVGTAGGLALVWLRYGRPDAIRSPAAGSTADGPAGTGAARAAADAPHPALPHPDPPTGRTTGRTP